MNPKQEQKICAWCVLNGIDLQYQKISFADLRNSRYNHIKDNRQYQVHSDDSKAPWSAIYDDINAAAWKFIELKSRVRKPKHLIT